MEQKILRQNVFRNFFLINFLYPDLRIIEDQAFFVFNFCFFCLIILFCLFLFKIGVRLHSGDRCFKFKVIASILGRLFRKYKENSFFRLFPYETKKIPFCELNVSSGNPLDLTLPDVKYRKFDVLVALTHGLCGGLICQPELIKYEALNMKQV